MTESPSILILFYIASGQCDQGLIISIIIYYLKTDEIEIMPRYLFHFFKCIRILIIYNFRFITKNKIV